MTTQTRHKKPLPAWQKIVMQGFFLYVAIGIPLNYVHEAGHALFCAGPYKIGITAWGGYTTCKAPATLIFNMAGGLFGAMASGALAFVALKKHWYGLAAPALAFVVDQTTKVFVEGFYPALYDSGKLDLMTTAIQLGGLGLFMYLFIRKESPKSVASLERDPI